jgi:hypothetical protein
MLHRTDTRLTGRRSDRGKQVDLSVFELTEVTRQALDDYLRVGCRKPVQCLFPKRHGPDRQLTTRQYARLVGKWISGIGLPLKYAIDAPGQGDTHLSPRRQPARGASPGQVNAPAIRATKYVASWITLEQLIQRRAHDYRCPARQNLLTLLTESLQRRKPSP